MDPAQVKIPPMKDLTDANITENTNIINSQGDNKRVQFLITTLVNHLHDFARETRLTTEEWMTALRFLTTVGQMCVGDRQEFILLSDILGLSMLVNAMNHPTPPGATESTVLGPFHSEDSAEVGIGESIASEGKGEPMLVLCTLKDLKGNPIKGAKIDVWETDSNGKYDLQYDESTGPDCRGTLISAEDGNFNFKGIFPVSYPIPHDGPAGKLLSLLKRHPYRPAHLHFKIMAKGFDDFVTALYVRGDPYETSDAVFGVKSSLVVDIKKIEDEKLAKQYGMGVGDHLLVQDFVIVTKEESKALKDKLAAEALQKQGIKAKLVDGLPVADDVD